MNSNGFLQAPSATAQKRELPTLLAARARKQHPWNAKQQLTEARGLQINIPQPDQLEAYPAEAVRVQNTFIHVASPAASFEPVAQSCPSRHIGCLRNVFDETSSRGEPLVISLEEGLFEAMPSTPEPLQAGGMGVPPLHLLTPDKHLPVQWRPFPSPEVGFSMAPPMTGLPDLGAYHQMPTSQPMSQGFREANAGSAELPSLGSRDHSSGACKPCAFLHAKGCDSGALCQFCHLCDAGEKKRRQKARKAAFKAASKGGA